ncbi:MAG: ATP-binding protein [Gemmatimonadota bacterium]|nr:ATP-binding protein [Gemmatimonadota bacterium]
MASREDLLPLITEPREDLASEYKDWLDLTLKEHKATLAKAAIALANHGGGYIVIGFAEQGQILESQPRPEEIPEITQDSVNAAVHLYAEPNFQCAMHVESHPDTHVPHPIVIIPSATVPVMSRRECQGVIAQNRCYIRKPGPNSEDPRTSEEWRTLLNRCVRANQDELLEAIRSIVTGRVETPNSIPTALDDLRDYCTSARGRWEELVSDEPDNSPARFPHGYYEMAFSLVGATPVNDLIELQDRLSVARRTKLSGWPPFLDIQVPGWNPYPHEDFVEAWLGGPAHNGRRAENSYLCDFWRVSLDGKLYTICGYFEDEQGNEPGRVVYTTTPVLSIGEGLLFASRLAETFEEVNQIAIHCRFTGLEGRCLRTPPWSRLLPSFLMVSSSSTDEVTLTGQITQQQVQDNLAEFLHPLLQRLYEKFNFSRLSFDLVAKELQKMRNNRV